MTPAPPPPCAGPFRPGSELNGGRRGEHRRGKDLGHVPDEVVVDLTLVEHHKPATSGLERCFDELDVHPPESVAVFDDDRRHLRIGEQTADLCPSAVHARADLGLHSGDRQPGLGRPLAQRATCRSRSARWSWDETRA